VRPGGFGAALWGLAGLFGLGRWLVGWFGWARPARVCRALFCFGSSGPASFGRCLWVVAAVFGRFVGPLAGRLVGRCGFVVRPWRRRPGVRPRSVLTGCLRPVCEFRSFSVGWAWVGAAPVLGFFLGGVVGVGVPCLLGWSARRGVARFQPLRPARAVLPRPKFDSGPLGASSHKCHCFCRAAPARFCGF
jgi:hypothetical protein